MKTSGGGHNLVMQSLVVEGKLHFIVEDNSIRIDPQSEEEQLEILLYSRGRKPKQQQQHGWHGRMNVRKEGA